jgi:hypothetical protein
VQLAKEAYLVREKREVQGKGTLSIHRCLAVDSRWQTGTSCAEPAEVKVDGLDLCHKHALEAGLEGQIFCWNEMLFQIDLWSREASRRDKVEISKLLNVERANASSAIYRAQEDLDLLWSETSSVSEVDIKRGSGPLQRAARLHSAGPRRR